MSILYATIGEGIQDVASLSRGAQDAEAKGALKSQ